LLKIKEAFAAPWRAETAFGAIGLILLTGYLYITANTGVNVLDIVLMVLAGLAYLTYAGYVVSVAGSSAREEEKLPLIENIPRLLFYGVGKEVVKIIYAIPLLIIVLLLRLATKSNVVDLVNFSNLSNPSTLIVLILAIVTAYFAASAVVQMAQKREFSGAFTSEVFHRSFTSEYLMAFILSLIIGVIGFLIGYLTLVTRVIPVLLMYLVPMIIAILLGQSHTAKLPMRFKAKRK